MPLQSPIGGPLVQYKQSWMLLGRLRAELDESTVSYCVAVTWLRVHVDPSKKPVDGRMMGLPQFHVSRRPFANLSASYGVHRIAHYAVRDFQGLRGGEAATMKSRARTCVHLALLFALHPRPVLRS